MKKNNTHWEEDPRFKQCNQEFFATLLLFVFNVVIVLGGSAILGHGVAGENMQMVFGLPAWFFWGGIVATLMFCLTSIIMVIFSYKNMSLEADDHSFEE